MDLGQLINNECYKEIKYENIKKDRYFISPDGKIFSKYLNRLMKPKLDKDGYLEVSLRTENKEPRYFRVHHLVAFTYIGKPSLNLKDPTIDHIDNHPLNNHYSNLRWVERGYNSSIRHNKGIGELNHEAILTDQDVIEICELLIKKQYTLKEIGEMFNVSKYTISNIKRKVNWKHISEKYDFGSTDKK